MTPVSQLTPFTCVAACLESYFIDVGIAVDQCKILKDFPQYCYNPQNIGHFGIMSELQLICFTKLFLVETTPHLHLDQAAFANLVKSLTKDEAVFVMAFFRHTGTNHCVRFSQIVDEDKGLYEFMSPVFGGKATFDKVGFTDLMQGGFGVFHLRRIVTVQPSP